LTTTTLQIQINEEYQNLVSPLTEQEYIALKQSIRDNGLWLPIVVNAKGIVLDGHHRLKICRELGIEPRYEIMEFESANHEALFVIDCNLKRRHQNQFQKLESALKAKPYLLEIAKKNSQSNLKQNQSSEKYFPVGRVNEEIGKRAGVSYKTVEYAEEISKHAPAHILDKVKKGQISIHKGHKLLQNELKRQELINAPSVIKLPKNCQIYLGDISEEGKKIPDNSIDIIPTDPPYAVRNLYLYEKLGVLAARVLKPGGSLIVIANYE
jgi:hypothetical protein